MGTIEEGSHTYQLFQGSAAHSALRYLGTDPHSQLQERASQGIIISMLMVSLAQHSFSLVNQ